MPIYWLHQLLSTILRRFCYFGINWVEYICIDWILAIGLRIWSLDFMQQNNNAEVLTRVKRRIRKKMDLVFDAYLPSLESDFPICESPVWIFGRSYSIHYDIDELRRCVSTCMWITYRKNFPSIGDSSLTSDRGWGCMARCGQMILAKALLLRHLGPDWHWTRETCDPIYLKIVSLFADIRSAPLSLHQIAQSGASLGKPIGSWLGPNTVAQALKKLLSSDSLSVDVQLHIAMDSTVVKSEVKRLCLSPSSSVHQQNAYHVSTQRFDSKWKPLLLIIPLRLGLQDLNPSYVPAMKAAFEIRQNLGIIGGRPNHALYFIGYAENEVLFLDPHTVQNAVTVGSKIFTTDVAADETYHLQKPGRMSFSSMDPSIAVCFFCRSELEFDSLCSRLTERFLLTPLPLFEICERRPQDWTSLPSSTSPSTRKSPSSSLGFTHISHSATGIAGGSNNMLSSAKSALSPHSMMSFLTGNTSSLPSSSSSHGNASSRNKSDVDDEEFEILG